MIRYIINFFLVLIAVPVFGQQRDLVRLIFAEKFSGTIINGEPVRIFEGRVHVERDGIHLYCNTMTEYTRQEVVHATGNVKIIDGSDVLTADFGKYYPKTRFTEVRTNVRLVSGSSILTSDFGTFSFIENKARFWKNTRMVDSTGSVILSDTLDYDRATGESILTGQVSVQSDKDRTLITGTKAWHSNTSLQSRITGDPEMIQWPEEETGDTLFIRGKELVADRADSINTYAVFGNGRLLQGELAAASDTMLINRNTGLIDLMNQPMVWFETNQVSADTIQVLTLENELRELRSISSAFSASEFDSLKGKFNQLRGRQIIYFFSDRQIDRINVAGNSESVYYLEENGQPNGANAISGDSLSIFFVEGEVDQIRVTGGVEGKLYPERDVLAEPLRLRGFQWRSSSRPSRNEFKGDFKHDRRKSNW